MYIWKGVKKIKLLGENIKRLRLSKGMTQPQLADVVGATNYSTISKWESGANSPKGKDLVVLSNFFGVSVDSLLNINNGIEIAKTSEYTYYPESISAGLPVNVDGMTNADKINIPDSIMGKHAGKNDIYITKISGDSMDKIMQDGSLIAVKPTQIESLKDGDMVVFSNVHEYIWTICIRSIAKRFNETVDI